MPDSTTEKKSFVDEREAQPLGEGPRSTPGARLLFGWTWVWISLVTIPFSIIQLLTHRFDPTAHNFKRWAAPWGRLILRGAGVRVKLTERAPLDPEQPYVFVANHQNAIDILALAAALPYPFGFLAKAELQRVPFLSLALRNSPSLFVERSDPRRALESLKAAGARIRSGTSVLVFPEGGRSFGPALDPFKKGAFLVAAEAGVPLVPVTVLDSYRLMDERCRASRPGTVHIVVGEPIPMEGMRRRELPQVMQAVRRQMEAELRTASEDSA